MVLVLAAGCGGVTLSDPPPPPPAGPTSLRLLPEIEDVAAAQALGWETGIPDAEVTVTPVDSSAPPRVVTSNATGVVDLSDLTAGVSYGVDIRRWLTSTERSHLPATEDVLGWVARTSVAAGSGDVTVRVPASRKHGLVVSEWAFNIAAPPPVNETYRYGGYLEIYNNGDTTSYLDGLTLSPGLVDQFDFQDSQCALLRGFRVDPLGIWTRHVQQFPGDGQDYPVPPGGIVTVAIDAIDHSQIVAGGLDLSHANFEFWGGPGDVDNPDAPNMIDTLSLGADIDGHGPFGAGLGSVVVLARPYRLSTVVRSTLPSSQTADEWARIPRENILDVVTLWPGFVSAYRRCPELVNSLVDRSSSDVRGANENIEFLYSVSRRAVVASGGGRPVLQYTRNSGADFVRTSRTPGVVP